MKNATAIFSFTMMILLSIPVGKCITKIINHKSRALKFNNNVQEEFDDSLRNYHPNKGE
jgi:hypothetical protein